MTYRLRVDNWFTGRLGDFQQPLVEALLQDGRLELRVVFAEGSPRAAFMSRLNVPVIQSPQISQNIPKLIQLPIKLWQCRQKLSNWYINPPDITHVTMLSPVDIFLLPIVARSRSRVLTTVHDAIMHIGEESVFMERIINHLIAISDNVVVLSKHAESLLRPRLPRDMPLHLVERGLIVNAGPPSLPKIPKCPDGPIQLLFFGRIQAYKGLDILLEAIKLLRQRNGPNVHLTIAGSGDLTPYNSAIQALDNVSVHVNGWMTDAERDAYFAEADVQVVPYIETSISGVILTGMWAGLPTIATPLPAFFDYLEDGVNAVIASNISAEALAQAISRVAENPSLLTKLKQGTHNCANLISATSVANNWIELYSEIATSNKKVI